MNHLVTFASGREILVRPGDLIPGIPFDEAFDEPYFKYFGHYPKVGEVVVGIQPQP